MEVYRSEIKVGLLVAVSFVLFMAGVFIVSDIRKLWSEKKTLTLLFPYADGITKGSPVWYAGVEVGAVTDVKISKDPPDKIAITVSVNPDTPVRRDSRVDVRSLGMMGAKYVEMSPGTPDAPLLASGDRLEGKSPASMSEIMETGQQVAAHLADLVQETRTFIAEIHRDAPIAQAVQNANTFLVEIRDQSTQLKSLIGKLDTFADTLNDAGKNVKQVSGDGGKELTALLKELRETNKGFQKRLGNVETNVAKTLGRIDESFAQAEGCATEAKTIVSSSQAEIATLLGHLREASRHIEMLTEDLRAHPWKIVWKNDGTHDVNDPNGTEQWREKGRIGRYGKEQ
ncbi:MAG: MlaD family protein [Acidobacteriota bacterium]